MHNTEIRGIFALAHLNQRFVAKGKLKFFQHRGNVCFGFGTRGQSAFREIFQFLRIFRVFPVMCLKPFFRVDVSGKQKRRKIKILVMGRQRSADFNRVIGLELGEHFFQAKAVFL